MVTMIPSLKAMLGSFAFAIFWVLAVFPAFPLLPIGRSGGSLLGAVLMVVFEVTSPAQAYASIDLSILAFLFGTMVVGVYLERADAFEYVEELLTWKSQGAKDLIFRICLVSAITSAFFTNDTSRIVLTELVLKTARKHNLPPHPFLLAVDSSANIGSSATPIGNLQNLVIATKANLSFGTFLGGILPAALTGIILNSVLLLCMFWRQLSSDNSGGEHAYEEIVAEGDMSFHRLSPGPVPQFTHLHFQETGPGLDMQDLTPKGDFRHRSCLSEIETLPIVGSESPGNSSTHSNRRSMFWKSCVYLITTGMITALIWGMNMSWTALTSALALVVLDFKDAQPCLDKVSYSLLVFFCGMFMTIDGFEKAGIPSYLWEMMEPYAQIDHAKGITILALIVLVLSNSISNVTTVLLLGEKMAASAATISPLYEKKAWLILAWASTVSPNLSLVGSGANLIVCENARAKAPLAYNLSFWSHLKFGVPSTVMVIAIGLTLVG